MPETVVTVVEPAPQTARHDNAGAPSTDPCPETRRRMSAGNLVLSAARIRAEAELSRSPNSALAFEVRQATRFEETALGPLSDRHAEIGAGGELVPTGAQQRAPAEFINTIRMPSYVTAAASRERLDLAQQAGALEIALDAADTTQAQNSIEQMLAHQLAASHASMMKLTAQLNRQIERMGVIADGPRQAANVEATRLAGAVARGMTAFQNGVLVMQKLRTGGRQVVTVQHVNVGSGGQAVVAGSVSSDRRGQGERAGSDNQNGQ